MTEAPENIGVKGNDDARVVSPRVKRLFIRLVDDIII